MSAIHDLERLHRLDLNLVLALDTLARERSVTRAAQRAGVTQSAMSHTLRRLRELLDDPVLVRGRGGMVLTPRAERLVVPLRGGLLSIARALGSGPSFDPARATRTFRFTSPDLFDALALPRLLRRAGEVAPAVSFAVVRPPARLADALETGDVDLAVAPVIVDEDSPELAPDLRRRALFRDGFSTFVRADHPARRLTRKAFLAHGHVLVSPTGEGRGLVDRALAERGEARRIALRVPQFSTALAIVQESDLILTAPSALRAAAPDGALRVLRPPVPLPDHAVTIVWHARFTEEPGHAWLREQLIEIARDLPTRPRRA